MVHGNVLFMADFYSNVKSTIQFFLISGVFMSFFLILPRDLLLCASLTHSNGHFRALKLDADRVILLIHGNHRSLEF